ncbi:MAG: DegT/DnrJ/EryC1/StrS family aminotransferase [Deltaproteobacteria bacterium]|nr:MAG: DegT/DnrJ/EryC1/StrS family aminotransferase [Deltaproteobacteria bacterium]
MARTAVRTRVPLMDLRREYHASRAELLAAWERVLGRMQLIGGEEVRAFEAEMAAYLGVHHVRGVASGTDALWLAVAAAGVGPGDEVLVQANAFVAAVEALQRAGARPVPVDIRLEDLGPDPDDLAARLSPHTRGLLVVHLYGLPVDLRPLLAFARERRLIVIEDCSHAHGATLDGRRVGSFGVASAFSLGVVKNLAAYGDAGIVATDDGELAERVRLLGNHGQAKNDARNRRRAEIAAYYTERLHGLVVTPPECPSRTAVYHQYVVRTPRRDALRAYLAERDIETGIHYPVPVHRQPAWIRTFGEGPALPRAERAAREILSLPVHPDLTDEEVEHVADAVRSFFRG